MLLVLQEKDTSTNRPPNKASVEALAARLVERPANWGEDAEDEEPVQGPLGFNTVQEQELNRRLKVRPIPLHPMTSLQHRYAQTDGIAGHVQAREHEGLDAGISKSRHEFNAALDSMIIQSDRDQAIMTGLNELIDWPALLSSKHSFHSKVVGIAVLGIEKGT